MLFLKATNIFAPSHTHIERQVCEKPLWGSVWAMVEIWQNPSDESKCWEEEAEWGQPFTNYLFYRLNVANVLAVLADKTYTEFTHLFWCAPSSISMHNNTSFVI